LNFEQAILVQLVLTVVLELVAGLWKQVEMGELEIKLFRRFLNKCDT
jgi:hypothetical protein